MNQQLQKTHVKNTVIIWHWCGIVWLGLGTSKDLIRLMKCLWFGLKEVVHINPPGLLFSWLKKTKNSEGSGMLCLHGFPMLTWSNVVTLLFTVTWPTDFGET